MMPQKIKAAALQMTLFVIVVIALLLGAFVLLTHLNKLVSTKTDFVIETVNNATRGIDYCLYNEIPYNETFQVKLHGEPFKNLSVEKKVWGAYQQVTSYSNIKIFGFNKIALIGGRLPEANRTALYLENTNKPLVVVGTTRIEGDAYVSEKGIRPGNISGQSYYGTELLYGTMRLSTSELPKIDKHIINNIKASLGQINNYPKDQFIDLDTTSTYSNSFFKSVNLAFNRNDIVLDNKKLSGHIIVKSEISIHVTSSSTLKDVILVAPKIFIANNVKSNFQAIATDSIIVGKNVKLSYPSALVLNPDNTFDKDNKTNMDQSSIIIGKGSDIKGCVISLGTKTKKNYNAQIHLKEGSSLYGQIYCNGNLELEGTVYGSVYTSGFVSHQNGSVYQNHIFNGKIFANDLSDKYVGLTFENGNKQIMQWLY